MSDKDKSDLTDLLVEQFKAKGVASMGVKDGRLWLFKRSWLQALLDSHPELDEFQVLIQDRKFGN